MLSSPLILFCGRICQNPFRRSNIVTYLAFPILSIQSSILGIGKLSVLLKELTFLKSVHIRYVPSGFGTRIQGETPFTLAWYLKFIVKQILIFFSEIFLFNRVSVWMLFHIHWIINVHIMKYFVWPKWKYPEISVHIQELTVSAHFFGQVLDVTVLLKVLQNIRISVVLMKWNQS